MEWLPSSWETPVQPTEGVGCQPGHTGAVPGPPGDRTSKGKGRKPRAEAVPWCFRRHSTQAISQLQLEAIVTLVSSLTSPHLCHPCTALKQSGHCSGQPPGWAVQHNTKPLAAGASLGHSPGHQGSPSWVGQCRLLLWGSSTPGCMECIFKRINLFFCICGHIFGWGSIVRRQIMQEIFS